MNRNPHTTATTFRRLDRERPAAAALGGDSRALAPSRPAPGRVALVTLLLFGVLALALGRATAGADRPAGQAAAPAAQGHDLSAATDSGFISGLVGSPHDFTTGGAEPRDLCLPCHTPHLTQARRPLLDQRPEAREPWRAYRSGSVELDNASLMCLSCHDGVIASDIYSRAHSLALAEQVGTSRLGSQALRSHPLGIEYPAGRADYHPAEQVTSRGLPLPGGRIQCTTCHDPHNRGRHDGLLVISNRRSALCLACHRL